MTIIIKNVCNNCFRSFGVSNTCYCYYINIPSMPRSKSIEQRDDYWIVRFDDSITVEDYIMNWVTANFKPTRWFMKNYCSLGFYDRDDAVLCHLRFA